MSKHTPGPWRVLPEECDKPYIRIRGSVLGGRYKIANVITPCYEGVHEREAAETRANARLIAEAPALASALRGLMNLERRGRVMPIGHEWDAARAVMAALEAQP